MDEEKHDVMANMLEHYANCRVRFCHSSVLAIQPKITIFFVMPFIYRRPLMFCVNCHSGIRSSFGGVRGHTRG